MIRVLLAILLLAAGVAEALDVDLEPYREVGYQRLMRLHMSLGNRAEALRVYESWIHTHFVTDGQHLPTDRVREIERGLTPTLRDLGIVFGVHLEREHSDPGIRVVLECRPNPREMTPVRRRLAEIIAAIPRRPRLDRPGLALRVERRGDGAHQSQGAALFPDCRGCAAFSP